jgi:hypothetical protein
MRRLRRANVGAVIAAVAAVLGIWFSAFSAYETLEQQEQTREATQLGLVTELTASARDAFEEINAGTILEKACTRPVREPTPAEDAAVFDALGTLDYLAWLQRNGRMGELPDAQGYWRPMLLSAYELAHRLHARDELKPQFPNLVAYADAIPAGKGPPPVCG